LPAWSGGGDTYDDEVPPPKASVEVIAPGSDVPTGASYSAIGEWSRAYHATQGMGRWIARGATRWPLHLRQGPGGQEADIRDKLPATLGGLADHLANEPAEALRMAQHQIDVAISSFPDRAAIIAALVAAADAIESAEALLGADSMREHGHRLARKLVEIDAALLLADGIDPIAWAQPNRLPAGASSALHVQINTDNPQITVTPLVDADITLGAGTTAGPDVIFPLVIAKDTALSQQFAPDFASLGGNGALRVAISATVGGRLASTIVDLEEPLTIAPAHSVVLEPATIILNGLAPRNRADMAVAVRPVLTDVPMALDAPKGWQARRTADGFDVTPPANLPSGLYRLPLRIDGQAGFADHVIAYPHIGRTHYRAPQALNVLALDVALPADTRVGYVGGGSDRVGYWLAAMGLDVTVLDDAALLGDLSGFTSIVIGTFAFGQRPALRAITSKLHEWVAAGGHLVTLYHRPTDGWDPTNTPPLSVHIGSPSLRWRVTDPAAPVEVLMPESVLLTQPNAIGPDDWAGWDKERGLYFASQWDAAYEPLLAMSDAGEAKLTGALISARIGRGRHTHTSLVLHHQLDLLVPGAFRLMANLVQPA
ncbi:MAG: PIG-L family deacetylase, partial [Alphaproteobacteria bacterium]|nr:PIG-L family deacetylase [Alphaproteobacteria bacterium]